jgi:hypothetical protein
MKLFNASCTIMVMIYAHKEEEEEEEEDQSTSSSNICNTTYSCDACSHHTS